MEFLKFLKRLPVLLFLIFSAQTFGQQDFNSLLKNAKNEFKTENYTEAAELLEKAIAKNPNNAEAHYFLGYCYSRMNANDGKGWIEMNLPLLLKTSYEFEAVNKISAKYTGEVVVLDPYSKISSEWASMAINYLYKNKADSALWAFNEGKKRGGFGELFLAQARFRLNQCSKNAFLFTFGDNATFPLWYVQNVEGLRKDVAVIDLSMLNTTWYTDLISRNNFVEFDLPKADVDTIEYMAWKDSLITINNFSWTVKPSYSEFYILRGDRLLLSILKKNQFTKDVYFTTANDPAYQLGLQDYFLHLPEIDKVNVNNEKQPEFQQYKALVKKLLADVKKLNKNSLQELNTVDNIRFGIMKNILNFSNKANAQEMMNLIDFYVPETEYPYQNKEGKTYADAVREYITE